ncbi:MAG TPA: hypothetical protein VFZ32_20505 [Micromonosporaceae bacterium]|jgi:hypothetical protein
MDSKLLVYLVYLALSMGLTAVVARILFRHGKAFLADVFGDASLADSLNRLLVVAFFLVSLGYVAVSLRFEEQVDSASHAVELLSMKLGLVLLGVGVLHGLNLYALSRIRRYRHAEWTTRARVGPQVDANAMSRQPAP